MVAGAQDQINAHAPMDGADQIVITVRLLRFVYYKLHQLIILNRCR